MARAHFRFAIGPEGRRPGAPVCAGDIAEGTIVVQTPKAHSKAKVLWSVEWVASGKSTNRQTIGGGAHVIGDLYPDVPEVVRIRVQIPPTGPVSYQGTLFQVAWVFRARLDIPWAIDPSGSVGFLVAPRPERAPRPAVPNAPPQRIYTTTPPQVRASARPASSEVCPFCRDGIEASERYPCPTCQAPHHAECFQLYGRCTIPGCRS